MAKGQREPHTHPLDLLVSQLHRSHFMRIAMRDAGNQALGKRIVLAATAGGAVVKPLHQATSETRRSLAATIANALARSDLTVQQQADWLAYQTDTVALTSRLIQLIRHLTPEQIDLFPAWLLSGDFSPHESDFVVACLCTEIEAWYYNAAPEVQRKASMLMPLINVPNSGVVIPFDAQHGRDIHPHVGAPTLVGARSA